MDSIKWRQNIEKMNDDTTAKQVSNYTPHKRKDVGRLSKR